MAGTMCWASCLSGVAPLDRAVERTLAVRVFIDAREAERCEGRAGVSGNRYGRGHVTRTCARASGSENAAPLGGLPVTGYLERE